MKSLLLWFPGLLPWCQVSTKDHFNVFLSHIIYNSVSKPFLPPFQLIFCLFCLSSILIDDFCWPLLQISATQDSPAPSGCLFGGSEHDAGGGCGLGRGAVHLGQSYLHGELIYMIKRVSEVWTRECDDFFSVHCRVTSKAISLTNTRSWWSVNRIHSLHYP